MKIEVEKIKDKQVEFKEYIPASAWEMDSVDIHFVGDICLKCAFVRMDRQIIVTTEVSLRRVAACSRCLAEVSSDIKKNINLCYDTMHLGDCLEIDKDVREEILLDYPMRVFCRPDCKGLCPHCGVNLNMEQCRCKKME